MSDVSANLSLPYIQPSQAQKHVTHNEGMRRLDALVQMSVTSAVQSAPPGSPDEGMRYILPTGASGDWAGHAGELAVYEEAIWVFYPAKPGWTCWVGDDAEYLLFDGSDWVPATPSAFQNLDLVGIQTTADTTNRLAVSAPATLLTHEGAGHQLKVNKAATADTASLLFQSNWSGRAEMGTIGSDDFQIKVSPDGTTFHPSMLADADTGEVSFPSGVSGLTNADFGDEMLVTRDYIVSRGDGIVTNATGLLGNNYNYPAEFAYDSTITPNLPASFGCSGYYPGVVMMDELVAVDPNVTYRLTAYLRQEGLAGDWSAYANEERHSQYMGLLCLDADQEIIQALHHKRFKSSDIDSLTTLSAPLTPGDTTIQVTDSTGWNDSSSSAGNRGVIIFRYENSSGYSYPYYSRLVETGLFDLGQVNKTTHTITLNQSFPAALGNPDDVAGTWPAGTPIANSSSGSAYKYAFFASKVLEQTDTWYRSLSFIGGIDTSGTNAELNFPPGTAYVRPMWLPNYSNRSGGYTSYPDTGSAHRVWFAGISIQRDPLAAQSEITTGAEAGSKAVKVPKSNYASGTITLEAAGKTFTEV